MAQSVISLMHTQYDNALLSLPARPLDLPFPNFWASQPRWDLTILLTPHHYWYCHYCQIVIVVESWSTHHTSYAEGIHLICCSFCPGFVPVLLLLTNQRGACPDVYLFSYLLWSMNLTSEYTSWFFFAGWSIPRWHNDIIVWEIQTAWVSYLLHVKKKLACRLTSVAATALINVLLQISDGIG